MTLLLTDARLVGAEGDPVDVLVAGGRVASIAPAGTTAPAAAEVVPLDGRWLGPSLRDAHVHFSQWAMLQQRLDLSEAASAAEAAAMVRASLGERPLARGERFVGHGFRDGLWPDAPGLDLLDDVSTDGEIVLVSGDLHCVWLNSRACERFGFAGHPTGLLREYDAVAVTSVLADIDAGTLDAWVADAARAAAARGVTEIVELEWAANDEIWARRVANGDDLLRVHAGVYPDRLEDVIARGMRTGDPIAGTAGLVRMGP